MAEKVFNVYFQLRNNTEQEWLNSDYIPLKGEPCVVTDGDNEGRIKIGDGIHIWSKLNYSPKQSIFNFFVRCLENEKEQDAIIRTVRNTTITSGTTCIVYKDSIYDTFVYTDENKWERVQSQALPSIGEGTSGQFITNNGKEVIWSDLPIATDDKAGAIKLSDDFALDDEGRLILYVPLTLIASMTPNVAEKGNTIQDVTISWQTNKTPDKILLDDVEIPNTQTSEQLIGQSITEQKSFQLEVSDIKTTLSKTLTLNFYDGVYTGAVPEPVSMDSTFVQSLNKSLQPTRVKTFTVNAEADDYIWYCCPLAYRDPNFNVGGFDGGFRWVQIFQFFNQYGHEVTYQIWRSDNKGLGQTTVKVT